MCVGGEIASPRPRPALILTPWQQKAHSRSLFNLHEAPVVRVLKHQTQDFTEPLPGSLPPDTSRHLSVRGRHGSCTFERTGARCTWILEKERPGVPWDQTGATGSVESPQACP